MPAARRRLFLSSKWTFSSVGIFIFNAVHSVSIRDCRMPVGHLLSRATRDTKMMIVSGVVLYVCYAVFLGFLMKGFDL